MIKACTRRVCRERRGYSLEPGVSAGLYMGARDEESIAEGGSLSLPETSVFRKSFRSRRIQGEDGTPFPQTK